MKAKVCAVSTFSRGVIVRCTADKGHAKGEDDDGHVGVGGDHRLGGPFLWRW